MTEFGTQQAEHVKMVKTWLLYVKTKKVECYHDCNGFCTISPYGGQCPFEGGEKLDCEDYKEDEE